jgi:hypothetical protein
LGLTAGIEGSFWRWLIEHIGEMRLVLLLKQHYVLMGMDFQIWVWIVIALALVVLIAWLLDG